MVLKFSIFFQKLKFDFYKKMSKMYNVVRRQINESLFAAFKKSFI